MKRNSKVVRGSTLHYGEITGDYYYTFLLSMVHNLKSVWGLLTWTFTRQMILVSLPLAHIKSRLHTDQDARYQPSSSSSNHLLIALPSRHFPFRTTCWNADKVNVDALLYSWFDSLTAAVSLITVPVVLNEAIQLVCQMRFKVLNQDFLEVIWNNFQT